MPGSTSTPEQLADLGADVIKLEPAGGDASRHVGWTKDAYGPMFSAWQQLDLDLARTGAGQA